MYVGLVHFSVKVQMTRKAEVVRWPTSQRGLSSTTGLDVCTTTSHVIVMINVILMMKSNYGTVRAYDDARITESCKSQKAYVLVLGLP